VTTAEQAVELATELEADADEYPEERGEILLEAAGAWIRAGRPDRAERLLADVIDAGGEDACDARVELVALLLDRDRADEARAQLEALAHDPVLHDRACLMAAEVLDQRDDLDEALRWYDRAVARLSQEAIDAVRGPGGWIHMAAMTLRARRDLRERLGLAPDAMDEVVPEVPADPLGRLEEWNQPSRSTRALTFQRAERAEARLRWPAEFTEPDDEFYPAAERRWREIADSGVPVVRVVPATVAELVAFAEEVGGSPTDSAVRERFALTVSEERTLRWPPQRNAPCWCGSGAKYKKCCGRAR
jgi:tetratricopeptide (TPR) repeat protein